MSETREDIAMQKSWEDREIDRLRSERDTFFENYLAAGAEFSRLLAERDALRELVREALTWDVGYDIEVFRTWDWTERAEKALNDVDLPS
jgi:hypothetical protein